MGFVAISKEKKQEKERSFQNFKHLNVFWWKPLMNKKYTVIATHIGEFQGVFYEWAKKKDNVLVS